MILIESLEDLKQLGISYLTGEACNYYLRCLCDVNEDGRKIILRCIGLPQDTKLQEPQNSSLINNKPPVGSIFFPYDLKNTFTVLGLYNLPNVKLVIQGCGRFFGLEKNEELEHWKKVLEHALSPDCDYETLSALLFLGANMAENIRIYRGVQPTKTVVDGSCVSAMTGRHM